MRAFAEQAEGAVAVQKILERVEIDLAAGEDVEKEVHAMASHLAAEADQAFSMRPGEQFADLLFVDDMAGTGGTSDTSEVTSTETAAPARPSVRTRRAASLIIFR